jgi:hypothetical protein
MCARPLVLMAAMSVSLGLLSLDATAGAAPVATKFAVKKSDCRCAPLPRPGLQADYQYYYDTPGYFPGFYPGAGYFRELGPSPGSGFSEGPLGPR